MWYTHIWVVRRQTVNKILRNKPQETAALCVSKWTACEGYSVSAVYSVMWQCECSVQGHVTVWVQCTVSCDSVSALYSVMWQWTVLERLASCCRRLLWRRNVFVYPVAYPGILFPWGFQLIQLRTERTGIWGVVSTEGRTYRRCCSVSAWICVRCLEGVRKCDGYAV